MAYQILIPFLAYELITIFGVGIYLAKKGNNNDVEGFTLAGRTFGLALMVPTLVLVMLGTGHTIGALESSYTYGWVQVWFVIGHVFILSLECVTTTIWVRKLRATSISEIMGRIYGDEMKICIGAVNSMFTWGIISIETQGMAILVNTLTGFDIKWGIIIGGILGLAYTLFSGMKQTAILNFINLFVLYIGLALATFYIAIKLPGQNFDTIRTYYENTDPTMLHFFGTKTTFLEYAIPSIIAPLFCHSSGQLLLQPAMAAKNVKVVKKAVWFCGPINCLVGIFIVTIGLTAKARMEMGFMAQYPAKIYAWRYMLANLPPWVMSLLVAAVFAGVVSSFAGCALAPATIFVEDIYKPYFKPDITQKQYNYVIRITVVVVVAMATAVAQYLPGVINGLNWLFAWNIPSFFLLAYGLYWKINKKWSLTALLITWLINCLWCFTPLHSWLGLPNLHPAYITLGVSLVLLTVGNIVCKGETAYFRTDEYLSSPEYKMSRAEELEDIA